jgi:ATP-dependent RNA helicase DeaD
VTNEEAVKDVTAFRDLGLGEDVLKALVDAGYESPSPIQAATIPLLLAGRDVVGQAQTGTGKTAAFALPVLSRIDVSLKPPQALVLVPTRELAIQVAEAFQRYASHMRGFHVLPIYGGQSYTPQLHSLKRGVHVVVGTPGRVMDHMKRGTLDLSALSHVVLDEADEMLQMGFLDDVEWILSHAPKERTVALFSATLPAAVRRIAQTQLRDPAEVTIKSKTTTAANIRQRYWVVSGMHKLDALTRLLEAETFDAMLVFARTKQSTEELAERLGARGFAVEALNGDIAQAQRERTVARLKSGQIDIVVATDVAARGLDVERISHVINFDVPYDTESYVHRIGRTGRAGRSGEAILFIAPRERNMLRVIERATRQVIEPMQLPTVADVNQRRITRFTQRITEALASGEAQEYRGVLEQYEQDHNVPAIEIAAALASMLQGKSKLQLADRREPPAPTPRTHPRSERSERPTKFERTERTDESAPPRRKERAAWEQPRAVEKIIATEDAPVAVELPAAREVSSSDERPAKRERPARNETDGAVDRSEKRAFKKAAFDKGSSERPARSAFDKPAYDAPARARGADEERPRRGGESMETYRVEVGLMHGVKPGNIVGAIANEAGLDGKHIGRVDIRDDHSFVDLPEGMPKDVFRQLQKVRVAGQMLQIGRARGGSAPDAAAETRPDIRRDPRERAKAPGFEARPRPAAARKPLHARLPSERPARVGKAAPFRGKPAAGKKIFAKRKDKR